MAESSIQVKVDAAYLQASTVDEAEQTLLREYAVRAARSCAWLPHKRRSGKPREIFRNSSRRFFRLERELYKLRSGEPSEDLKVLYENLRLVRTDIQDLEFGTKILTSLP